MKKNSEHIDEQDVTNLFENSSNVIFRLDRNLRYIYLHPQLLRPSGLTTDKFLGKTGRELGLPTSACDLFEAACYQAFATAQVMQVEYSIAERAYVSRLIPEPAADGAVESLMGITEDITANKKAEAALQLSEEQRRLALDLTGTASWDWHLTTEEVVWSDNMFNLLGLTPGTVSPTYIVWRNCVYPEDLEQLEAAITLHLQNQTLYTEEYRVVYPDGSIHWLLSKGQGVYDATGQAVRMVGITLDITARKLAEQKIQQQAALLDIATEAIFICDLNCRILYWNTGAERMYGWQTAEVVGKDCRQFLYKEISSSVQLAHTTVIEHGQWYGELQKITKSGQQIIVQTSWILMRDHAGQSKSIFAVDTDITERKKLEVELTLALAKEKELHFLKSRLLSMASHEFRTPLSTIISSAELLEHYRNKWSEEKQITHLHRIQIAAHRITEILDDVLALGKAEITKLDLRLVPIDVVKYCLNLVAEFQLNVKNQHTIAFSSQQQSMPCYIDEKSLGHILSNLLSNAIKYSHNHSTIQFTLKSQPEQVIFEIQDQGIGIPPQDLPHLFESFYRGTNVENIPGTGLGLAIVKKYVDIYHGEIAVTSQLGFGSTFSVTLPSHHIS